MIPKPPTGAYQLPPRPNQPWQQAHAGRQPRGGPSQPHSYRWLIPSLAAAAGLVIGGIVTAAAGIRVPSTGPAPSVTVTATPAAAPGPQGYRDPAILEHALKSMLAKRLGNPSGQYYEPGLKVKSVLCVDTSKTAATCLYKLSGGQAGSRSAN